MDYTININQVETGEKQDKKYFQCSDRPEPNHVCNDKIL